MSALISDRRESLTDIVEREKLALVGDVDVFSEDMLDDTWGEIIEWIVQWPNGHIEQFDTEEKACEFRRHWRKLVGLDPITGTSR